MYSVEFLDKMKKLLLKEKSDLLLKAVSQDSSVDTDGDEFDEIQGNQLKEMQNQLCYRDNMKLIMIDNALSRLDNKEYGLCEDCGSFILEKRLLFNPYVSICVDCAEDREVFDKQRKRDGY